MDWNHASPRQKSRWLDLFHLVLEGLYVTFHRQMSGVNTEIQKLHEHMRTIVLRQIIAYITKVNSRYFNANAYCNYSPERGAALSCL